MDATISQIASDGPYLRVNLTDVLPPNWDALRRDLEPELEEGATRVTFVLGRSSRVEPDDPHLVDLVDWLCESGAEVVILNFGGPRLGTGTEKRFPRSELLGGRRPAPSTWRTASGRPRS